MIQPTTEIVGFRPVNLLGDLQINQESIKRLTMNSVTGLHYETAARLHILQKIDELVLRGNNDLTVIETDMNGLKGLNDVYGEEEANKGIRAFADDISHSVTNVGQESGLQIQTAVVNVQGEGSDTIKIVIIGKNISGFVESFVKKQREKQIHVPLTTKVAKHKEDVIVTGGWGHCVVTNEQAKKETTAGEIYEKASEKAVDLMDSDKVHGEAHMVQTIKGVQSLDELLNLEKQFRDMGSRPPSDVFDAYREKIKQLSGK